MRNPSLATIFTFDRFERDEMHEGFNVPAGCEVREARDEELWPACILVRAHLPPITADALDVNPADLSRPTRPPERGRPPCALPRP